MKLVNVKSSTYIGFGIEHAHFTQMLVAPGLLANELVLLLPK